MSSLGDYGIDLFARKQIQSNVGGSAESLSPSGHSIIIPSPFWVRDYIGLVSCNCSHSFQAGVFQAWREAPLTGRFQLEMHPLGGRLVNEEKRRQKLLREF